jgi:hypothetical protein
MKVAFESDSDIQEFSDNFFGDEASEAKFVEKLWAFDEAQNSNRDSRIFASATRSSYRSEYSNFRALDNSEIRFLKDDASTLTETIHA